MKLTLTFVLMIFLIILFIVMIVDIRPNYNNLKSTFQPILDVLWIERADFIAIGGVLAVLLTYGATLRREVKHNRKRSIKTLKIAIEDLENRFKSRLAINFCYLADRREIKFRNTIFDTYVFETIIHSGLLTYVPPEIQKALILLYDRVQSHNEYFRYRIEFVDRFYLYGDHSRAGIFLKIQEAIDNFLTSIEKEMENSTELVSLYIQRKKWR